MRATLFDNNPIGYVTYKRTYSRDGEEYEDTVNRCITACIEDLNCGFSDEERERLKGYLYEAKILFAGRFFWQMGTKTVEKHGLTSMQNCAGVAVDDPIRPFTWGMDLLMLGCGVGFNIQREYVYQLPKVKRGVKIKHVDTYDCDIIVPDNREGWVKILRKVLESYFITGKGFTYTTKAVRVKGSKIQGFGGTASGPEVLVEGLSYIAEVLSKRAGKKLRPIDAGDIACIIGWIVVAGNVRRSAIILLGDYDDIDFLNMKRWDLGNIPKWRSMSNNSIVYDGSRPLPKEFKEGYEGKGEPYGLSNLKLSRECGRIGEKKINDNIVVYNPCHEQPLEMFETCALGEIILSRCSSYEEALDALKLLYRVIKHSLTLHSHVPETEAIVHKNMRMGISPDGFMSYSEEHKEWMSRLVRELGEFDIEYSSKNGLNPSVALFTVKPSGTLSLLADVPAGCHPAFAPFYIRRIRMSEDSPLLAACREAGCPVEPQENFDGSLDRTTYVVSFPYKAPANSRFAKDVTAIDQLEVAKWLQKNWSDNAVSCTVYYRPEELLSIWKWLEENYANNLKGVSFLLHRDHGFKQAPLEEISEEQYKALINKIDWSKITGVKTKEEEDVGSDCEGGACPIR
jgi:ribonucleoside-diphosphate reductase alpha chain